MTTVPRLIVTIPRGSRVVAAPSPARPVTTVGIGARVAVMAGPPAAQGMFQPASVIAPVRVIGVDDPAVQRAVVDGAAGVINRFFQDAQAQHQLTERGFTHTRRVVDGIDLRFIHNGGQSLVQVRPGIEVVRAAERAVRESETYASPPVIREGWIARYAQVEWAGPHRGPGLTTGVVAPLSQMPIWGDAAVNRARGPGGPSDWRYGVLSNLRDPFWRGVQISPTQGYFSTFFWGALWRAFETEAEAMEWQPEPRPRDVEGLWWIAEPRMVFVNIGTEDNPDIRPWSFSTWVRPPSTLPFLPMPEPIKLDVFRVSVVLSNLSPTLLAQSPDLHSLLSVIGDSIDTVSLFSLQDWPELPPIV